MKTIKVKKTWNGASSALLCYVLDQLELRWMIRADNGRGSLIIEMDDEDDARLLGIWEELSDIRARYLDARQRSLGTQLTFLEARE